MNKLAYLITSLLILTSSIILAGWSEPMRLTYRGNEINPQVVARHDTVHVVWSQASSAGQISYIRSTDNGETWGNILNLTETGHIGQYAHLNVSLNKIWVSWFDNNYESIAIRSSVDGNTWSTPIYKYTIDSQRWSFHCMAVTGDTIFLTYHANIPDSTGFVPFKFLRSPDGGHTWSNLTSFAHSQTNAGLSGAVLTYCDGNLIFALDPDVDSLGGGPHIVGYVSYDKGDHWSEPILISPMQQEWALLPSLSCNQLTSQIAIGYMDYRYQQYAFYGDIFIRLLESDPYQLGYESQATDNHTARFPSIAYQGNNLVTVWSDRTYFSTGDDEIFFNSSTDAGITWEGVQRLASTPTTSTYPWVYNNNDTIHVVWYEDSSGSDIYYLKYTPDSSDIINNDVPIPTTFKISAYPNPFNSTLSISIESEEAGEIIITNILGRIVTQLKYPKGNSSIKWDATDNLGQAIKSGAYFIQYKGGINKDALKVMYLK